MTVEPGPFKIAWLQAAEEQMQTLAAEAKRLGIKPAYLLAWGRMVARLQRDPLGWGNPAYHTHHKGGIVCHGIDRPVLVVQRGQQRPDLRTARR